MNAKQYLERQIQALPEGAWETITRITDYRLSFEETFPPMPVEDGYEISEFWLRKDGVIMRRKILYRDPQWSDEKPDETHLGVTKVIYTKGDGYLIGDPEYSDEEIGEDEYTAHIKHAEAKLQLMPRTIERWKRKGFIQ